MLMKWLRVFPQVISGWEMTTLERPILWLKGWGFEPQVNQTSRERRGIEVQLDGQMIQSVTLFNKTPIKTPLSKFGWVLWLVIHTEVSGGWGIGTSQTLPYGSLLLTSFDLYPFALILL